MLGLRSGEGAARTRYRPARRRVSETGKVRSQEAAGTTINVAHGI